MSNNITRVSASQFSSFDNCPRQWYFTKMLKLEPDPEVVIDDSHLRLGSCAHRIEEVTLKALMSGDDKLKKFIDRNTIIPGYCKKYHLDEDQTKLIYEFGDNCEKMGWYKDYQDTKLESKITFKINTSIDAASPILLGYIDRLDMLGPKKCRIIDLKTSKKQSSHSDIKKSWQTKLYAYKIFQMHPELDVIEVEYWFIRLKKKTKTFVIRQECENIYKDAIAIVQQMHTCNGQVAKQNFCNWCSYQQTCKKWTTRFEGK